jgi:multidrug efflux pump subunit AcrA (membrane-fusion protein)
LQKKQAFTTGKNSFAGQQVLYNAGVISKNEYITAKTQFDNNALDYLQAQYALEEVLRTVNIDPKKIEALSLSDTQQVNLLLEKQFRHVAVYAPGSGIALFPIPTEKKSGDTTSGKLAEGVAVKEGQLLLSIGDLTGLSASFDVSEVDIDRIHENMPVTVTGTAFSGAQLKGFISAVSSQAKQGSSQTGLSLFTVKIKIPTVDSAIMKEIRVGMTAKFEVDIKSPPRIMLPVNAVFQYHGKSAVKIVEKNGAQKIVPVIAGETTPTDVVILDGVKVGDRVVVP